MPDKPHSHQAGRRTGQPVTGGAQSLTTRQKKADRSGLANPHDLNLAACYCDRLVLLHEGGVHAEGAPSEVLTPDVLERAYGFRARVLNDDGIPVVRPVVTA